MSQGMNLNLNLDGFMKEIQQVATPSKERQIPPPSPKPPPEELAGNLSRGK